MYRLMYIKNIGYIKKYILVAYLYESHCFLIKTLTSFDGVF